MTTETLDKAEPETLCYGYGDTALGAIVVAEINHGVALFIDGYRGKLLRELKDAFPEPELVLDQLDLQQAIVKAAAFVDAPHIGAGLILDLRAARPHRGCQ